MPNKKIRKKQIKGLKTYSIIIDKIFILFGGFFSYVILPKPTYNHSIQIFKCICPRQGKFLHLHTWAFSRHVCSCCECYYPSLKVIDLQDKQAWITIPQLSLDLLRK